MATVQHLEHHLHVVGAAEAASPAQHVVWTGGGDEVVVLPRLELHRVRHRGEGSEGESEDPEEGDINDDDDDDIIEGLTSCREAVCSRRQS